MWQLLCLLGCYASAFIVGQMKEIKEFSARALLPVRGRFSLLLEVTAISDIKSISDMKSIDGSII